MIDCGWVAAREDNTIELNFEKCINTQKQEKKTATSEEKAINEWPKEINQARDCQTINFPLNLLMTEPSDTLKLKTLYVIPRKESTWKKFFSSRSRIY